MANITDLLQKIVTVTMNVDELKSKVKDISATLLDHRDRLVRLESNAELVAEQAKVAALTSVMAANSDILKEIFKMRQEFSAQIAAAKSHELNAPAGQR